MKHYTMIFVFIMGLMFAQGNIWAGLRDNGDHKKSSMMENKDLEKGSMHEERGSRKDSMLEVKIDKNLVCMINDKYMEGKEQIPIEVEGKTYYGCCQGCVTALNYKRSTRYSIDPFSGNEVDKASAYIVLDPDGSKKVFYFESAENYLAFISSEENKGSLQQDQESIK